MTIVLLVVLWCAIPLLYAIYAVMTLAPWPRRQEYRWRLRHRTWNAYEPVLTWQSFKKI